MNITRNCLYCQEPFEAREADVKRNRAKYCGLSCSSRHAHERRPAKEPNVECAYCGIGFYKPPSRIKQSKSGLFFCCREHKDMAQTVEFGLAEIWPDHYSTALGTKGYRGLVERAGRLTKCEKCGYNNYPDVLEVHHKDGDRTNNDLDNLQVLCPTCHREHHFLTKTGRWAS